MPRSTRFIQLSDILTRRQISLTGNSVSRAHARTKKEQVQPFSLMMARIRESILTIEGYLTPEISRSPQPAGNRFDQVGDSFGHCLESVTSCRLLEFFFTTCRDIRVLCGFTYRIDAQFQNQWALCDQIPPCLFAKRGFNHEVSNRQLRIGCTFPRKGRSQSTVRCAQSAFIASRVELTLSCAMTDLLHRLAQQVHPYSLNVQT